MLKFIQFLCVGLVLLSIPLLGPKTSADTFSWLNSSLGFQKGPDVNSLPSSLNSNIDCQKQDDNNCSIPTTYGAATQNSTVRLNGTSGFQPVISFVDNKQHFLPIPNSSTFISYTTLPPYGFNLYFNYNFASSITKTVTGSSYQYNVNRTQDARLVDKANHLLAADYTSMNFSPNGQWMVVSMPNVAMLKVNLQTFEVIPFASGFNYTIGIDPAIRSAITNDGRYAVVSSQGFNTFKIYDLSTCTAVPDTINGPVSCQSRDLQAFLGQQLPGYSFASNIKFNRSDALSTYATYLVGSTRKTAYVALGNPVGIINKIQLLALGESYISGEGAFDYQSGTDASDNKCHLSLISYPLLAGHDLNFDSYHSVACSGALTADIINSNDDYKGQAQNRTIKKSSRTSEELNSILVSFKPGYINQSDFVVRYQPQAILISIGGNDIGFSKIITRCGVPWNLETCYGSYEDRLELVREINNVLFSRLVNTYQVLKNSSAPDARIYVVGYPQIAKPGGDCALNVHLRDAEVLFSQQLIGYLDSVIQLAAAKAGVYYVDTQDALNGHRLCEAKGGSVAVNGLTLGNDAPTPFGPIGNESYHPNDLGHQLLENKVLALTHNLTNPMPVANLSVVPPSENGLEILNAVHSGRPTSHTQYDDSISDNMIYANTSVSLSIDGWQHALKPSSTYKVELHSSPTILGNISADTSGNLNAQIQIPSSSTPGSHTLHIYGTNIAGDSIDIYKTVFVGASLDDYDGDGIKNASDPCQFIAPAGQDYDKDGVDDACDGMILDPPPAVTYPISTTTEQTTAFQFALSPSAGSPLVTALISTGSSAGIVLSSDQNAQISLITDDTIRVSSNNLQVNSSSLVNSSSSSISTSVESDNSIAATSLITPKVLGAQTSVSRNKKLPLKIVLVVCVAVIGIFSGISFARKNN